MNESNFQHILRVLNTNLDGKVKVMFALTSIKGVGRRFSNIACKKAEVDLNKRAGELTAEEVERLVTIVQNPRQFKVRTRPPAEQQGWWWWWWWWWQQCRAGQRRRRRRRQQQQHQQ
jgi:hypothetical protein